MHRSHSSPGRRPALLVSRAFGVLLALVALGGAVPLQTAPERQGAGGTRVPVLLVPGWGDDASTLEPLRRRFLREGWPEERVLALSFRDPEGSNVGHAGEVGVAVARLLARTGASRVDLVAHSMGGLAVRYYLLNGEGGAVVRRVVYLGTPHRGTLTAHLAWGSGGREMEPGSPFLLEMDGKPVAEVESATVRTPIDLRVFPGESAMLPWAVNLEVCCPTHAGLLDDEQTFEVILGFLSRP